MFSNTPSQSSSSTAAQHIHKPTAGRLNFGISTTTFFIFVYVLVIEGWLISNSVTASQDLSDKAAPSSASVRSSILPIQPTASAAHVTDVSVIWSNVEELDPVVSARHASFMLVVFAQTRMPLRRRRPIKAYQRPLRRRGLSLADLSAKAPRRFVNCRSSACTSKVAEFQQRETVLYRLQVKFEDSLRQWRRSCGRHHGYVRCLDHSLYSGGHPLRA